MNFGPRVVLAIIALVAVLGYWLASQYFSGEAKWERRRRRSNSPIASKRRRPSIKFSVHTEQPKKSKKR